MDPGRASDRGSAGSREDNKPAAQTLEIRVFILRRLEPKESRVAATLLGRFTLLGRRRGACDAAARGSRRPARGRRLAVAISPRASGGG